MPLSSLVPRMLPLLGIGVLGWSLQTWLPGASLSEAALDTRERLRGTWLREYSENGFQVRRVLALGGDGAFRENVRVADRAGKVTEFVHEGQWLFDGTNLKRKYTLMDGKPPSRLNLPFATIEVAFQSRNDFVGIDHIHRRRMEYRRLAADR